MEAAYAFAQLWLSVLALVLLYVFVFRRQDAERCRSELRRVRDRLFDFMDRNGHDFSAPAYIETRRLINGLMRLTTATGPVTFIAMMVRYAGCPSPERAIDRLPNGRLKQELLSSSHEAVKVLLKYIFLTGCCGMLLRAFFGLFQAAQLFTRAKRWATSRTDVLCDVAIDFGSETLNPRQRAILDAPRARGRRLMRA